MNSLINELQTLSKEASESQYLWATDNSSYISTLASLASTHIQKLECFKSDVFKLLQNAKDQAKSFSIKGPRTMAMLELIDALLDDMHALDEKTK